MHRVLLLSLFLNFVVILAQLETTIANRGLDIVYSPGLTDVSTPSCRAFSWPNSGFYSLSLQNLLLCLPSNVDNFLQFQVEFLFEFQNALA